MPVGGSVDEGVAICATVEAALFHLLALCLRGLERCLYEAVSTWAAAWGCPRAFCVRPAYRRALGEAFVVARACCNFASRPSV